MAEASGWVEITVVRDEQDIHVRRTVKARKVGKDQWQAPDISLFRVERAAKTRLISDHDGLLQVKLDTLVPESLFDAFYFKGEPLDGKLLGGVGGIRESLASFLHEDRWEEAENAAEAVRQAYTRDLAKLTEQNSGYAKLLRDEELFRSHLLKEQQQLAKTRAELDTAAEEFNDTTVHLQELGSGGDGEKLVAQLREYRSGLDQARKSRERADTEIARLVGSSRGIPFLLEALPTARRILSQMQEDNILPADVSERFVNRVLESPKCVCGRVHDEETRLAWTRYKEKTLTTDLTRGLSDLLNAVNPGTSQSYQRFSAELGRKLEAQREIMTKAAAEMQRFDAAGREVEQKLQASPIEEIKRLGQCLRTISDRRQRLQSDVTHLEDSIESVKKNLKNLKAEMERARPSGALAQKERALQSARTRAEKLRLLIHDSREVLGRSFHRILQDSVSEYYDTAAYDGSRAKINRTTLLPAIESNGQVHGNLGGGQSQLLALAYIVSLSRMRKSLHAQMQKLGIGFGKLDDQSFFLDSPFNHMTDHYAHAIAKFLGGNARQVVVLLARHQWNLVKKIIEPVATSVFAFKYHTLPAKLDELKRKDPELEDFTYEYRNKKVKLVHELPAAEEHPYTTISPIH